MDRKERATIIGWLEEEIRHRANEVQDAKCELDEYQDALVQFKQKETLPRDVRAEYNEQSS